MASTQKAKIPVGFVIAGKYRVTGELGRGGMASVYEAENVDIGKRVAIKVLAQELISSTVVVERFLREARAAAAIRSPYICDVYDSGKLPRTADPSWCSSCSRASRSTSAWCGSARSTSTPP
ncbi:MAG: hypothetical protein IPM79_09195 [Polyangiaceae bacterium]|nr:hypothetical protein [Polyangiaceae bacterium]